MRTSNSLTMTMTTTLTWRMNNRRWALRHLPLHCWVPAGASLPGTEGAKV